MFTGKRYWIVGASEGLGRTLALKMSQMGAELVLSARTEARLQDLASDLPGKATLLPLDVMSDTSVAEAYSQLGSIDGIIYCVGLYKPMPAQEWDATEVMAMCQANYLGAVRILGHIVPDFNVRNQGHIVLIGSLAGFRGLPGATGYGSSKAALMHLAENLQADLSRTSIKVQLINPGFIKTRLTDKNDFKMPFIMTPEDAADRVIKGMESTRFQTNFPRRFSWVFRSAQFLPAPIYYKLFSGKTSTEN